MGKLTDEIKGKANEAIGKVKQQSANPDTRADGDVQSLKGKGQGIKGKIKGALGDDV